MSLVSSFGSLYEGVTKSKRNIEKWIKNKAISPHLASQFGEKLIGKNIDHENYLQMKDQIF